jgi:CelD/BcsL family acetyltransferase involved in cellulose biosynthesis
MAGRQPCEREFRAVRGGARPDVDLILLERELHRLGGVDNPFAAAPLQGVSPNVALAVDLSGGFEAVLERTSRKRKLKKHRSQLRKFEAAGGFRRFEAGSEEEVKRLLDAFFEMKAARFRAQGIADVFAPKQVREALGSLYLAALPMTPRPFALHGLEVGGTIRAVTASARGRDRIVCDFVAFRDDELSVASPGDFLIFENI